MKEQCTLLFYMGRVLPGGCGTPSYSVNLSVVFNALIIEAAVTDVKAAVTRRSGLTI